MEKHFCIHLYPEWPGVSSWLGKLFVRAIQELWQWWSWLLRVVVDTEEEEAVVMVLATAAVVGTMAEAVVEANLVSFKLRKRLRRAQEQFQMVLEEKSRFAFDVDLDAPKVRIPLRSRGSARCDSHFLLDFGHFTLHTAESQSDEQRHNLYSRFYISGRDFAAFFTDCGSDFGSCSLVKLTHDSQIISSPRAKEADNVYSVIDRCGMAVLVNQVCLSCTYQNCTTVMICIAFLLSIICSYLCLIQVTHRHVYPLKCQIFDGRILVSKPSSYRELGIQLLRGKHVFWCFRGHIFMYLKLQSLRVTSDT
ncbi:hypothetical protein Ahy_B02g057216 [Arachis hypogaea]|uniref:Uncharacterized protein n=1 Tax=Arachis hypogaea TaxID=3818 RepID=A0A445AB92_ARAHY|nr:hypothetical protein Ahy_B02g057216 [Arachis hypogaea]